MVYEPLGLEVELFERLLASVAASDRLYSEYREAASVLRLWCRQPNPPLVIGGMRLRVSDARWIPSRLFLRSYLVVTLHEADFRRLWPTMDAVAADVGETVEGFELPPIVFRPSRIRRTKPRSTRSVLDHEFVHLNQVIRHRQPCAPTTGHARELVGYLLAKTRLEYEANVLQFVEWPSLFPHGNGIRLDDWSVIRGYTQSLEETIQLFCNCDAPVSSAADFLHALRAGVPVGLRTWRPASSLAAWVGAAFSYHVCIALKLLLDADPHIAHCRNFLMLVNVAREFETPRMPEPPRRSWRRVSSGCARLSRGVPMTGEDGRDDADLF